MSEPFSVSRRIASFRLAIRGVIWMVKTQHNARIHAAATLVVFGLCFWLRISAIEWCWVVIAMTAVWTAEGFNSALERLADSVTTERDPVVGEAKDAAAGAVLIAAFGAAAIGLLVIGPHLLARF